MERVSDLTFPSYLEEKKRKGGKGGTFRVAKFCYCNPIIKKIVLVLITLVFKLLYLKGLRLLDTDVQPQHNDISLVTAVKNGI